MQEIAHEVAIIPLNIPNAYLVGTAKLWFLVDSGLPGDVAKIRKAVDSRFGAQAKPAAIVLTHGHPDHVGSAKALAEAWNVSVYVHRLEVPYLSGQSQYPPPDPTSPGFLAKLVRLVPASSTNLGKRLVIIDERDPFPGLSGWEAIHTPGHSPGHLSFFRQSDGVLLAGDAFCTMDLDSALGILRKKQKLSGPPVPLTIDWQQAKESLSILARLNPGLLAAGHGKPMLNTSGQLRKFSDAFKAPSHGRYVDAPAQIGENGVISLPPAPPDYVPPIAKSILVASIAVGIGAANPFIQKVLKRKK